LIQNFIYFFIPRLEKKEKLIQKLKKKKEEKASIDHVPTLKKVNINVNKFYFTKRVLLKCFLNLHHG